MDLIDILRSAFELQYGAMSSPIIMDLQEDVARRVFQQLLDALDYCHKRSIYHRWPSSDAGNLRPMWQHGIPNMHALAVASAQ